MLFSFKVASSAAIIFIRDDAAEDATMVVVAGRTTFDISFGVAAVAVVEEAVAWTVYHFRERVENGI